MPSSFFSDPAAPWQRQPQIQQQLNQGPAGSSASAIPSSADSDLLDGDDDEGAGGLDPSSGDDLLAGLLYATNRQAEAEPLMPQALAIDEASYGTDHPVVARDLNNLAQLLLAAGRLAEAERRMGRVLTILRTSLGSDHPNTKNVRGNYISLLQAMGIPAPGIEAKLQSLQPPT